MRSVECAPEDVGMDSERLGRLQRAMQLFVDQGEIPNAEVVVARHGKVCYCARAGYLDVASGRPIPEDALFRVYSMTKPITSVCLMQLYEEGRFQLGDNLSRYIPAFAQENMRVYTGGLRTSNGLMGAEGKMQWDSEPSDKPITIQMLLNHTAGLSYGFDAAGLVNPVDRLYHAIGPGLGGDREQGPDLTLEEYVDQLAAMPLVCQPGSEWNYSLCVDVQGRLIEVLTGQSFGEALAERIFAPLGMTDTFFTVPFDKQSRFCPLYAPSPSKAGIVDISAGVAHQFIAGINGKPAAPKYESGGGGLVSSTHDYYQFAAMLLNGGLHAATGHRVLSRKTLQYMTINHLPDSLDMGALSAPQYSEIAGDGSGFGLGFSVILDPARNRAIGSVGNFAWGGAAATYFWVDPAEQLVVVLMTQLMGNGSQHPDSKYADLQKGVPLRPTVSQVVYSAVVDGTTVSAQRAPMLPPSGLARCGVASFEAAVLTEIYLCNVCSCQENIETQRTRVGSERQRR